MRTETQTVTPDWADIITQLGVRVRSLRIIGKLDGYFCLSSGLFLHQFMSKRNKKVFFLRKTFTIKWGIPDLDSAETFLNLPMKVVWLVALIFIEDMT